MTKRRLRFSVHTRLTLLYSGLFLLAGVLLLSLNVIFFRHNLSFAKEHFLAEARAHPALRQAVQQLENQADQQRAMQRSERSAAEQHLIVSSLEALGIMIVVSTGLGWLVAGRSLRPIKGITAAAKRASENNLTERVALDGPEDELKELADTFDGLMSRLDAAFAAQRRFVANASHELRTPLAIMRTAIDVTLAKPDRTPAQLEVMATKVRSASERAERLVDGLLVLARSDRGTERREPVDLAVPAGEAVELFAPVADEVGIRIEARLAPAPTFGDSALLERMVENLVENAIRHNRSAGFIEITTSSLNREVMLSISNTGSEIPEHEVMSLFEPFRRRAPARTESDRGVGLGLSIVASVATAHDGHVSAQPRPGGGLTVMVALPAAPQPSVWTGTPAGAHGWPTNSTGTSVIRAPGWKESGTNATLPDPAQGSSSEVGIGSATP